MTPSFRQFAVSGSAAVAILGGAAAVTVATPSPASAVTQHVAERAVTAPVKLPDGRTLRITGMGGYGHHATAQHVATVAAYKTDSDPTAEPSIGTGLTPDGGVGAHLQNPVNGMQTGYNQQVTTQASGGAIATGVVGILILGIIVFFRVKGGHLKVGDAVVLTLFGVAVSGTVIGALASQLTNSGVGSLGGVLGGL